MNLINKCGPAVSLLKKICPLIRRWHFLKGHECHAAGVTECKGESRLSAPPPAPESPLSDGISVLQLTQQMATPWGLKQKEPLLPHSGGQKSKPKVSPGSRLQGRVRPASSSFWRPQAAAGCGPTTLTAASVIHSLPLACALLSHLPQAHVSSDSGSILSPG